MKEIMINLIELAVNDKSKIKNLEDIYTLYEELQFCEDIEEMAESLISWLCKKYKIKNIKFSLFDMDNDENSILVENGNKFYLDDKFSSYFIINTHTDLNAVVAFSVETQEKHDFINENKNFIDATFFLISPILQNGIIKKHHIESSSIDSATNVHNRQYLIERINKIISLSKAKKENIAFLMIGIDRFKAVIEEFDYDVGDKVLIALAKVIHSIIRESDIVGRLRGDEFLIALINLKSKDEAEKIALKIIKKFAETKIVVNDKTEQTLQKTICIGVSFFPDDSTDINQVLKNADNFLSEAKNKGRSQIAYYSKEQNSTIDLF